jgi:hypothetical protein
LISQNRTTPATALMMRPVTLLTALQRTKTMTTTRIRPGNTVE